MKIPPYTPPHVPFWQSRDWGPADWLMHVWRREVARLEFEKGAQDTPPVE